MKSKSFISLGIISVVFGILALVWPIGDETTSKYYYMYYLLGFYSRQDVATNEKVFQISDDFGMMTAGSTICIIVGIAYVFATLLPKFKEGKLNGAGGILFLLGTISLMPLLSEMFSGSDMSFKPIGLIFGMIAGVISFVYGLLTIIKARKARKAAQIA